MVVDAIIRAAAVGGIAMMWTYFTLKTFKICKKIVFFTPPPEEIRTKRCEFCSKYYTLDLLSWRDSYNCYIYVCHECAEKEQVCVNCQERFF